MLPNPIILNLPFHVWLGILAFIFLLLQVFAGLGYLKLKPFYHTKVFWRILVILVILHAIYGISFYL